MGGEGEDGGAVAEGWEVLGLAEDDALTAAEAMGELVDDEKDVGQGGVGGRGRAGVEEGDGGHGRVGCSECWECSAAGKQIPAE